MSGLPYRGPIRGAAYRIDLGKPRGHEQGGKRYGVVVSPSDSLLSVVTVIPTSTQAGSAIQRPEVQIAGRRTRLLVDQVRSIDTDYLIGDPVGYLSGEQMAELNLALAHYLGGHGAQAW
jgi:mRNA interferase MazF